MIESIKNLFGQGAEKFLNRYSLVGRIGGLAFAPIVGLVLFSAFNAFQAFQQYQQNVRIEHLAEISKLVGKVIHETQQERGLTAVFVGVEGGGDSEKTLAAQRASTDEVVSVLKAALETDLSSYGEQFVEVANTANMSLDQFSEIRAFVSSIDFRAFKREQEKFNALNFVERQALPPLVPLAHQAGRRYGKIENELLAVVDQMVGLASSAEMSAKTSSLANLLKVKAMASEERALLVTAFSDGEFTPEAYSEFLRLKGAQETFLKVFRSSATPANNEAYDSSVGGDKVVGVEEIRTFVIDMEGGDMTGSGYSGIDWYKSSSAKIELIKAVEDIVETDIINDAHERAGSDFVKVVFFGIAAVLVTALAVFVFIISKSISRPLALMNEAMLALSEGDMTVEVPCLGYGSEVGQMASAVENFKQGRIQRIKLEEEAKELEAAQRKREEEQRLAEESAKRAEYEREQKEGRVREERAKKLEERIAEFDRSILQKITSFNTAIAHMEQAAVTMSRASKETEAQSVSAATDASEASQNVQTVAAASEEMASTISGINEQMNHSAQITGQAMDTIDLTAKIAIELQKSSQNIGNVIDLINDIAEQTNLLALNATIEAARAGDAGRGFAVVASEVKALSNQTSTATNEISEHIKRMQEISSNVVTSIDKTRNALKENSEVAMNVTGAVEQQALATQEISQNIQQVASGTARVSSQIGQVQGGAEIVLHSSEEMQQSTVTLANDSRELRAAIEGFLEDIRTI